MRFSLRSSEDFIGRLGQRDNFLEELRESFTKSFAYDLFEWPDVSAAAEVTFQPLPPVVGNESANTGSGTEEISDSEAVALYTTTASDIPLYMPGQAVPIEGDAGLVPSTSASSPLIAMDEFRVDARFDGIDGSGYTVAVLDSGIDLDDPFFGADSNGDGISDRIVYQYDFADGDADASDVDGHGSNVASIAASSDGTYTGMAPGADIAALKVFSDSGSGNFGYLESALQWVIDNAEAYNIVSVNMSLGDSGNYNAPVQLYGIADELATLASMDVIVVSASGNDFYPFNSFQGVSYPSADPNSLSVGAVYDGNVGGFSYASGAIANSTTADQIAPFSQRDDQLSDIFAPGAPITGAGAGAALETMHGTSQAAPHIAGIVAVAQQLAVQELGRKLTFDEFSQLLADSGDTIFDGDDEDDNVNNTGLAFKRVNMLALGEAILALAPPEPDPRGATFFQISAVDKADPEGDTGVTAFTFLITRSGDTSEADTVDYSVAGSGADPAAANDFPGGSFPSGSVTFDAGETSRIVTIEVAGDSAVEPDEDFTVTIDSVPANGQIVVPSDTATIRDDDGQQPGNPVVLVDADFDSGGGASEGFTYVANAFGGNNSSNYTRGAGTDDIRVVLGGRDSADIVDMSGGWAHSFTLGSEMEVTLSFLYEMILDSDYESDEFSQVLFSLNGGAAQVIATLTGDGNGGPDQTTGQQNFVADLGVLSAGTHTIVLGGYNNKKTYSNEITEIRFDDVQVTGVPTTAPPAGNDTFFAITADEAAKAEGDSGNTLFSFTVTRSGDTAAADSVDYAVVGSGVSGSDFAGGVLPSGTVAFAAGETSQTVTIAVSGDNEIEADEGFGVVLSNPSAGAEITTASAISIIENDDLTPATTIYDIAALDAVKAEGDIAATEFTFTVTRIGDISEAGSVDFSAGGGSTNSSDFVSHSTSNGTLNFAANEGVKTLSIYISGDLDFEGDENFTVTLSNPSNGATINKASAEGTILNDDAPPPTTFLSISALDATKPEGDVGTTDFTFTVTREGDTSSAGSVDYYVTAIDTSVSDFAGGAFPEGTIEFAAGETSRTLTIQVAADSEFEEDETFGVTIWNPSPGSAISDQSVGGIILNDDPEPVPLALLDVSAVDSEKTEGDSGVVDFTFMVSRSGNTSTAVSVDYQVSSLGVEGADFLGGVLPSGTIDFAAGETSKILTIPVVGDTEYEGDESFSVRLSNPSEGAAMGNRSAPGKILDDDPAPAEAWFIVNTEDGAHPEGDDGFSLFVFRINVLGDVSKSRWVDFDVVGTGDNPADAADFADGVLPSGRVEFAPNQLYQNVGIYVAGDVEVEPDEHFLFRLIDSSPDTVITKSEEIGEITNDEIEPVTFYEINALDMTKAEGDLGGTPFTFVISRSGDVSSQQAIGYRVSGSGSNPADQGEFGFGVPSLYTVVFAENQDSLTISLSVRGDRDFEPDEEFIVELYNPPPFSAITKASAIGTILNDDPAPSAGVFSISAEDAVKEEGNDGVTPFTFTVTRSGDTSGGGSIDYAVSSSEAVALDFLGSGFPSGTIYFDPGEVTKTLTIDVNADRSVENNETFTVTLSNPSAGSSVADATADGTILDDDSNRGATYFFASAYDAVKSEGDSGSTEFTFQVTRSGDTTEADTIDFAVTGSGPNPASADDFTGGVLPSGTVTFDVGETSQIVTIQIAGDSDVETDEGFTFTISNPPSNGQIQQASDDATIENDDFLPGGPFEIIDADFNGSFAGTEGFTYTPGVFGGTTDPSLTRGSWTSSDVTVVLGGGSGGTPVFNMTGGWERSFTLDQELEVSLSFLYDILHGRDLEADEFTQVLFSINGGPPQVVDQVNGDADSSSDYTVAPTTYQANLGILGPGTHTLVIGGLLNKKDGDDEYSRISIDDVLVTGIVPAAPATSIAIALEDAVKAEGDAGSTAFTFTVTRSGDTTAAGSVDYAVSGSDVDGNDFSGGVPPSGSVNFDAGETNRTITVQVAGDVAFEGDETFTVTLSNPSSGSEITTAAAEGTILNDDAAPPATFFAIAAEDAVKVEGDSGSTAFTFTVTRSGDVGQAGSVDYAVSGAAVNGSDFAGGLLPGGTVDFAAGQVSKTVIIEIAGDTEVEGNEAFTVTLSNPTAGSAVTTASADGEILNDDDITPPGGPVTLIDEDFNGSGDTGGFSYEDGSFGGGNQQAYADGSWNAGALAIALGGIDNSTERDMSGGWTADFSLETESEVSLSFLYELIQAEGYESDEFSQVLVSIDGGTPVVVNSLTGNGNGGGDQTTGQQTFSAALGILAAGDHSLTIGGFNNKKTWGNEASELTIDDVTLTAEPTEPPLPVNTTLSIAALDAVQSEGEDGTTLFTFVVSRSGDLINPTTVDYTVSGAGSNGADSADFLGGVLPGGSVTIDGEGVTETTLTIAVAGDLDFEADETFIVTLSNPSPGSAVDTATANGTILNDDAAPVGPMILVDADFSASGDTEGFTYSDGTFGGANPQAYADGSWRSETLAIDLGGIDNSDINDMSGAWEISFVLATATDVSLSFSYELIMSSGYEADEFGQVLYTLDGNPAVVVDQVTGNGNGGPDDTTGLQTFLADLGTLAAGTHNLAIGGLNNQKTTASESLELTIDDVLITGELSAAATASSLLPPPPAETLPNGQENEILANAGV